MVHRRTLDELQHQLDAAERESAAWQKSKYGHANAVMAAKLVDSIRAEIAAYGSSDSTSKNADNH